MRIGLGLDGCWISKVYTLNETAGTVIANIATACLQVQALVPRISLVDEPLGKKTRTSVNSIGIRVIEKQRAATDNKTSYWRSSELRRS